MLNKALRVLIADEQHFHRLKIERELNQMRYFRVAPVHRLEELLSLVEYGCEPFDLLIINASFAREAQLDLLAFCMDNRQISHAFIYDGQQLRRSVVAARQRQRVQVSPLQLPDGETLRRLMAWVDPQVERISVGKRRSLLAL